MCKCDIHHERLVFCNVIFIARLIVTSVFGVALKLPLIFLLRLQLLRVITEQLVIVKDDQVRVSTGLSRPLTIAHIAHLSLEVTLSLFEVERTQLKKLPEKGGALLNALKTTLTPGPLNPLLVLAHSSKCCTLTAIV